MPGAEVLPWSRFLIAMGTLRVSIPSALTVLPVQIFRVDGLPAMRLGRFQLFCWE